MKDAAAHVSALKNMRNENQLTLSLRGYDTQLMLSQRGVIETLNIRNHALSSLMPDWKKTQQEILVLVYL